MNAITGPNRIGGTAGCTRESLSSRFDSNIRGEARSTSLRLSPWSSSLDAMAVNDSYLRVVCGHRQHHVVKRQRQERVAFHRAALERCHLDIGQRDEGPLTGIQVIREPAAVAVPRQAQDSRDPVTGGLDDDPLFDVLHRGARRYRSGCDPEPMARGDLAKARWWAIRRAQNRK